MPELHLNLSLPAYAEGVLWLTSPPYFQQALPRQRTIELSTTPTIPLSLRWACADGAPLARWNALPETLSWNGKLRVGGHVDAAHFITLGELDLMIIEVLGNLLPLSVKRLPELSDLQAGFYMRDDETIEDEQDYWYAFILSLDDPKADFAHHALVNGSAVDLYGHLAEDEAGFQSLVGLPLLLDSLTLFAG